MVGERAISQSIKAANGKFAALLRAREEDEQLLLIGRVRIKEQAKEEAARRPTSGRSAWKIAADFSAPLPRPGRPRAADGMTSSFHFHCCSVTRSSLGTKAGAVAANHAAYVERDEAVEIASALDHAGYVERGDAVEIADRALIFSNISDDPEGRRAYWEAVDHCERQGHAGLSIKAAVIGQWLNAAADDLPPAFVTHCRAEHNRWATSRVKPKSFKPKRYRADERDCAAILDVLRRAPGWPDKDPPVVFTPGSAGRTQYRYVAELPHELGADDRAAIVRDFCDHLGSFALDAEGRSSGMMYTAVIHAPGPGNDRRNYHLHVIAHDRPAKWMPGPGKWDFEIAEEFRRKGETRVRYPHRQEKIVEVTRSLAPDKRPEHYNAAIAGKAFVPHLRERFAGICNDRLALRGIQRRIDARSHEALGIHKEPEIHLGTRAAALERAGVPTTVGRYNAAASWQYAALAERRRTESYFAPWQQQDGVLAKSVAGSSEGVALMVERRAVLLALAETRDLAWENDRLRHQARSRAQATLDHCVMSLAQVSGSVAHRRAIEKRKQEAEEHLAKVEAAIAAGEADIQAAAIAIGKLHLQHVAIDARLAELARERKARLKLVGGLEFAPPVGMTFEQQGLQAIGALAGASSLASVGAMAGVPANDDAIDDNASIQRRAYVVGAAPPAEPVTIPFNDGRHRASGEAAASAEATAPDRITEAVTRDEPRPAHVVPRRADEVSRIKLGRRHQLDALFLHIAQNRVPVIRVAGRLTVDALSRSDAVLLASPSFQVLIDKRLTGIAKSQASEIKRLGDAIWQQAFDPTTGEGPEALQTLWQHWRKHPDIRRVLPKPNGVGAASPTGNLPEQKDTARADDRKPVGGLAALAATVMSTSDGRPTRSKGLVTGSAPAAPVSKGPER
ncbi:hypothetical protein ASE95_08690 [Sphingomonas sp. Leaf231]|uniref:MobA/MobL family protein n=1 Tax=Sphingomonas sp. Leaf231 TaxID=1736301 RepID=UPI0006FE5FAD|nr:MobA/MobL family protein [Sphingomonas sp. Leaf231]KQN92732.1 hypothetical protein ASE95_08690 [Sphingomonas sp. Leaf231]